MFSSLFRQLASSVGVVLRTFRSFFTRQVTAIWAQIKSVTSLTRQASKLAPKMLKSATTAGKKPTKRSDYVETKQLFIAKSFFVILALVLVAAGLLIYFIIWPFLQSHFFTAKMWREDKDVADHSGRVVLYYDEKKTQPWFEGKLTDGLAQGTGVYYDENGLLLYSGELADGQYAGAGKLYDGGVLRYEGAFAAGVYEGTGTLYDDKGQTEYEGSFAGGVYDGAGKLYEDGTLLYEGGFAAGAYEGEGSLYAGGALLCKGTFSGGKPNGEGVEYYPNGQVRYKGTFLDGQYSGTGSLYGEDGAPTYTGEFSEGLYSGKGSLYPAKNQRIDAEFEKGETTGHIDWYKNGALYYSGSADNLTPDGFGTITAASGDVLYTGKLALGTLDMASLLGMGVNDIRDALGDAALTETEAANGFSVTSKELGLTVFCNFQDEDTDSVCYYAYLYDGADDTVELIPWANAAEFEQWLADTGAGDYTASRGWAASNFLAGVPYARGNWYCRSYVFDKYSCCLWSESATGPITVAEWHAGSSVPKASALSSGGDSDKAAARLDALVKLLNQQNAGGATTGVTHCLYYGNRSAAGLLNAAAAQNTSTDGSRSTEYTALEELVSYFEYAERLDAAEQNLALKQELLEDENDRIRTGTGDQKTADTLESDITSLTLTITRYRSQLNQISVILQNQLGLDPADYELQEVMLLFDPADVTTAQLTGAASAAETAIAAGTSAGTVTPAAASYDAGTASGGLTFTLDKGSFRLIGIRWGSTALTEGVEYVVSGNQYTIVQNWLDAQPLGAATLTFDLSGGADPTATVTITQSSTVAPVTAVVDKSSPQSLSFAVALNGNSVIAVQWNGAAVPASAYTVVSGVYTFYADWLSQQSAGSAVITFVMSAGTNPTVSVTVTAASGGGGNGTGRPAAGPGRQRTGGGRLLAGTAANQVSLLIIDLQTAHQKYEKALKAYEDAKKAQEKAETAYKTASVAKSDVYAAVCETNDARAEVYSALAAFTRQAAAINKLTGGYLSKLYNWLPDIFVLDNV